MFQRLQIEDWRQFERVDIDFHARLTVLTGANGSGKTTLLNLLSHHFGWNPTFVSTPLRRSDVVEFFNDLWALEDSASAEDSAGSHEVVGSLQYADGGVADVQVPKEVKESYQVSLRHQQTIAGLYVSSHRPTPFYQKLTSIPTELNPRDQLLSQYLNEYRQRTNANYRVVSPTLQLKQALVSLAIFGYGNQVIAGNQEAVRTFEGFEDILRRVLPESIGFRRILVEPPEVVLHTETGAFSIDAISGGVSALVDISWQLYMYSLDHDSFVVLFDELENHLHPALQRVVFPKLIETFDSVQFVAATHSPFIVSSVSESNVYVLKQDESGPRVRSIQLDLINRAGTSNEILRDVLGVPVTLPVWVEDGLARLVDRFSGQPLTEESVRELRDALAGLGLEQLLPSTLAQIATGRADD